MATTLGFDIYHGDSGEPDYAATMAKGISFVYHKIGQGVTEDPAFADRWANSGAAGISRGGYFFYDTRHSAAEQAQACLRFLKLAPNDLPIALDIETNSAGLGSHELASAIHDWLNKVERGSGKRPIIYTMAGFWDVQIPADSAAFFGRNYGLWVANFTNAAKPHLPQGWDKWVLWQFGEGGTSSTMHIPGMPNTVDSNRFAGTHEEMLEALGVKATG